MYSIDISPNPINFFSSIYRSSIYFNSLLLLLDFENDRSVREMLRLKEKCVFKRVSPQFMFLIMNMILFSVLFRSRLRMGLPMVMSWPRLRRLLLKKQPSPKEWSNLAGLRGCWWVTFKLQWFFKTLLSFVVVKSSLLFTCCFIRDVLFKSTHKHC